ncbi:DUF4194 domain-containing protein [Leifsonia shinshuensis]|uniref:DUF4194 domain-containing protein n=1 Tax=Leifsonia shinshuensis TaxID=150026 RepID=UPI001F50D302|nr:DUF4194 domain-containing protein [Leifsonia shinshuensis]MCI0158685.1 DUF4194 domain-containing protein [Leifsonia shinshuensis]
MTDSEFVTASGSATASGPATEHREDDGATASDAFGDRLVGDALPREARLALVTLLTSRFITRGKHPEAWRGLLDHETDIRARLEELFLTLHLDVAHEVAFKRQNGEDGVPVLLRREKPLSRDASLLLVLLRQEHAYTDATDEPVTVSRDHIAEFLSRFQADSSHDEVRTDRRVQAAIVALDRLELLTPTPEDPDLFVVSPAVVPLIGTDQLLHLERTFLTAAGEDVADDGADDTDDAADGITDDTTEEAGE